MHPLSAFWHNNTTTNSRRWRRLIRLLGHFAESLYRFPILYLGIIYKFDPICQGIFVFEGARALVFWRISYYLVNDCIADYFLQARSLPCLLQKSTDMCFHYFKAGIIKSIIISSDSTFGINENKSGRVPSGEIISRYLEAVFR